MFQRCAVVPLGRATLSSLCRSCCSSVGFLLVEDLFDLGLIGGQIVDQRRVWLELVDVDVPIQLVFYFLQLDVVLL